MNEKEILQIVLREIKRIGYDWRGDWSFFDGRTLRDQLNEICEWAKKTIEGKEYGTVLDYSVNDDGEYIGGTRFYKEQIGSIACPVEEINVEFDENE